ncbi:hypothetical protein ZIOFF_021280 [Zingiber officinale]|uniref:Uncharacterized protein n=1 Tax=Zingiber officinale TaxID=94328 RepID=A0A8J5HJT3_ZINOF|nr:hypothetical protein ZIOFF_021280 [Zingiber officinale]
MFFPRMVLRKRKIPRRKPTNSSSYSLVEDVVEPSSVDGVLKTEVSSTSVVKTHSSKSKVDATVDFHGRRSEGRNSSNLSLSGISVQSLSCYLAMKRGKSKTDTPKKANTNLLVKKGPERAAKKPRNSKTGKDPNTPKRP